MTDTQLDGLWSALALAPPLVALGLALWRKNVVVALLGGILASEVLQRIDAPWRGVLAVVDRTTDALASGYNARVLTFCLMVGGLAALMERSGGIAAFVRMLTNWGLGRTRGGAGAITSLTGIVVFIDTNLSLFTSAFVGKPLFDKLKLSRARLAYIIDSTCAPVSVLVLINGWGAYALGLLGEYEINPLQTLVYSVPLNFYALLAVSVAVFTAVSGKAYGPLARASEDAIDADTRVIPTPTKPRYMLVPILIMLIGVPLFMVWTGDGNILDGEGERAVLWSVSLGLLIVFLMTWLDRIERPHVLGEWTFDGVGKLLEPVFIILLSMAFGASLNALGAGQVLADALGDRLPTAVIPAAVFVLAGVIAFTTGTSWGTFAVMFPLAMPLALSVGAPPSLVAAAVLGGGVFGDHCSPISDTTVIASLAAGCDHFDHVRTQLPYALTIGAVTAVLYLIVGVFWA